MKKCIVIDDDLYNREIASKMLESLGYETHEAETVYDAYQRTQDEDVDVILVDWHMPDIDGPTFLKAMRKTEKGRDMVLLLYSAVEGSEGSKIVQECQADGFIPKPFTMEQLTEQFRSLGLV